MAKYKISLLTPVSDNNLSRFMPTELGSYNNQINYEHTYTYSDETTKQEIIKNAQALTAHANREQSFCYTYNEKYSQHQNAQKELTFSMDRNILLHDEWMHNPYVAAIHVGSIIELQDNPEMVRHDYLISTLHKYNIPYCLFQYLTHLYIFDE